jgi:hypothetical protein
VFLLGAKIGGSLNARGAVIRQPDLEFFPNVALSAEVANITGHLLLGRQAGSAKFEHCHANGEVRLVGAEVGGGLNCGGSHFCHQNKAAFNAAHLQVAGACKWTGVVCDGLVEWTHATVGTLVDDMQSWGLGKMLLKLEGFRYAALEAPGALDSAGPVFRQWQDRVKWLDSQMVYSAQPFHHLAAIYRAEGDDRSARKVKMAQFNSQLAHRKESSLSRLGWLWRWILRLAIGHGYEPWRAGYIALALWIVGSAVVCTAARSGSMVATKATEPLQATTPTHTSGAGGPYSTPPLPSPLKAKDCRSGTYTCLNPAAYVAELLFPVVKLDQRDYWRPAHGWYRIVPLGLVSLGWILTTLVVAGFTSLVRRD